jgi:hypothetical protein
MFYFSRYWILRYVKYSVLVMLVFLMMTILFMMPLNVRGEEIYGYTDKDGTIVITDIPPPQEDIPSDTIKSESYQDSTPDERLHPLPPQKDIKSDTRENKSYQDLTPGERLHWGRDNALIDKQNKDKNRQSKAIGSIDAGRYEVKVKKIGSNLYQDISTRIIIKTRACVEPAGGDESLLDWNGFSGELYFKKMNKTCIVKKVYK